VKKRAARKPLDPRVQIAVAVAAPLLVLLAGWLLLVSPHRAESAKVADQVASVEQQIEVNQAAAHRAPAPIRAADVFRLATAMPDSIDMPGIILQLSQAAQETGIQFASITPQGAPEAGTGYSTQKIDLAFSGNFRSLSKFLHRLRGLVAVHKGELTASGRLFSVEQLTFTEGQPAVPRIDATLTLDAYVYGTLAGTAPAAAAPVTTGSSETTSTTTTTTPASDPTAPTAVGTPDPTD
jgi:hypothetical protein